MSCVARPTSLSISCTWSRKSVGIQASGRSVELVEVSDQRLAVEAALRTVKNGDLLVVQAEDGDVETTVELVHSLLGTDSATLS